MLKLQSPLNKHFQRKVLEKMPKNVKYADLEILAIIDLMHYASQLTRKDILKIAKTEGQEIVDF
jgi:hypothetical protein